VKHTTTIVVEQPLDLVADSLADLGSYPHWNDVVAAAEPLESASTEPSWHTTLRARVGPFARSKVLRMARTMNERSELGHAIRFERSELDGRDHAAWIMDAALEPVDDGTEVSLTLHYDGGLWTGALDGVLGAAIDRATRRLPEYLASHR